MSSAAGAACFPVIPETASNVYLRNSERVLGYPQMDASLYLRTWDFLKAAGGFLNCIAARSVVADATCQVLGRVLWKYGKNRLPDKAWNAKFQLTASDRNLGGIRDLD